MEERKQLNEKPENISMTVEDTGNYEDPNVLLDRQMKEREMVDEQHKPRFTSKSRTSLRLKTYPRVQRTLLETQTVPSNL